MIKGLKDIYHIDVIPALSVGAGIYTNSTKVWIPDQVENDAGTVLIIFRSYVD